LEDISKPEPNAMSPNYHKQTLQMNGLGPEAFDSHFPKVGFENQFGTIGVFFVLELRLAVTFV
jgi:hypothetical protein